MADELITKQELIDAKPDVKNLGEAANGNETGIVTPRYGAPYSTAPAAIQKIESDGANAIQAFQNSGNATIQSFQTEANEAISKVENTGGFISAPTLAALQAITPEYDYQLARVDATGDEYRWNPALSSSVKWEPTGRNYIQDSKDYTDSEVAAALTTASNDASTKAENAENNSKNYVNEEIKKNEDVIKNKTMLSLDGIKKSDNFGDNVAFAVDSASNILFGYNTLSDKPIIANFKSIINTQELSSEILSAQAIRNLKKSEVGEIAAFVVDSAGSVLFGYDLLKDKPIIANLDVSNQTEVKKKAFEKNLIIKAINHMLFYGQSLTLGATATTILSTTQPYNNKTFNTGPRMDSAATSVIPLVEQFNNPSNDGQTNRGETPCSGAANYATKLSREQNSQDHVIFASAAGHGGYSISELEKGTTWYNTFLLNQVTKAFDLNGSDFKTQVVNWVQGEADITDNTDYVTYLSKLNQLQIDMNADVKSITGQSDNIPFITYQCSYGAAISKNIALAQLKLAQNNPMFFLASPTYRFSYGSDKTHLTNVGYKLMGAYFGRAYKQLVIDNQVPDFINPCVAKIVDNTIEVAFDVPNLPLKLDTTNLAATTNFGFKVIDFNNNDVSISSIVANENKIIITLASIPSTDLKVRYALDYLGSGLNILNGASGNLRDSTTDSVVINSTTHTLFHVCPHFELTAFLAKGI